MPRLNLRVGCSYSYSTKNTKGSLLFGGGGTGVKIYDAC